MGVTWQSAAERRGFVLALHSTVVPVMGHAGNIVAAINVGAQSARVTVAGLQTRFLSRAASHRARDEPARDLIGPATGLGWLACCGSTPRR